MPMLHGSQRDQFAAALIGRVVLLRVYPLKHSLRLRIVAFAFEKLIVQCVNDAGDTTHDPVDVRFSEITSLLLVQ